MQQPQFVKADGPNALKITISGSYKKTGDGEIVDFEDVEIIMPIVGEEYAIAAARKRYAYSAIKSVINNKTGEKKYDKPIDHIRNVYIDGIQEIEHDFEYAGKGIKQMSEDDLQHLAVEKGIREIPLPRRQSGISMREMRQRAYILYAERVLGWKIDMNDPAQNDYAKWNDIIPNPLQKAAPVQQKTAEEVFGEKSSQDEKLEPQHVEPQAAPVSSAPHVANPNQEKVTEPQPEVVPAAAHQLEAAPAEPVAQPAPQPLPDASSAAGTDELSKLQKLAKDNDVEYNWDTEADELRASLIEAGVNV